MMPRLKHLTLKGVHVDWTALADAVDASRVGGWRSLSLGSHSAQVRPSGVAFRRLLGACLRVGGVERVWLRAWLFDDDDNKWCGSRVERKGSIWEFAKARGWISIG